ncbi:hypothetical protein F5Y18DRAFT_381972 [Xylariaceae sp. FL1019]|nr:hypothetical protein F5Y18DRAFT_381972 [Xylariaceae sp. FL1019]
MEHSPKRCGDHLSNPQVTWADLALQMQADMGTQARRQYTASMLCKLHCLSCYVAEILYMLIVY